MKFKKILPLILVCIILSGCWDKVEIDRKSLVSIVGVDAGEQIGKEKELKNLKSDEPFSAIELKKLHITFGTPDISKLGPDKGGTAEDIYIDSDGYSMENSISKASIKSSRNIKFSHVKLLILGSELLYHEDTLKEVVDYLQRQPALNRMMMVIIAKGKVEDYIKYKPQMEKNIENYITGLMENSAINNTMLPVTLNEFITLLTQNGNAILPCMSIDKDKNEIKISGVGIIKDYNLKGYLTDIETSDLEILRGKLTGGNKVIFKDGHPIDVVIDDVERKMKMKNINGKLTFNIDINLEGEIKGYYTGKTLNSKDALSYIEKSFDKSLKEECDQVVKITQKEFEVDPIGMRDYVEKYHPKIWNEKKDNWPETYKNSIVNVEVHTKIRRIGVVK